MKFRLPSASIVTYLLALSLAATVPMGIVAGYQVYSRLQSESRSAELEAKRLADALAFDTAQFIVRGRLLLEVLAQAPDVRSLDPRRCDSRLRDFSQTVRQATNLLTLDAQGNLVCSVLPTTPNTPRSTDPSLYLEQARRTRSFTVGKPALGFISRRWVVTLAQPILDPQGQFVGAVALPVDLIRLANTRNVSGISSTAASGIVNAEGTFIFRSPDPQNWLGKKAELIGRMRSSLAAGKSVGIATGADGESRVYAASAIEGTDWHAYVGLSMEEVFGPGRRQAWWGSLLGLAAVILAGLLSYALARRITRPIQRLAVAVKQAGQGNLHIQLAADGSREMAAVAREFNAMVDARRRVEHLLQEAQDRYRQLFESSVAGAVVIQDRRFALANRAAEKILGAARTDLIGQECIDWIVPEDRAIFSDWRAWRAGGESDEHRYVIRLLHPEGKVVSVEAASVPIQWLGRPAVLSMFFDVSEQRSMAQRLQVAEKFEAVGQLSAGLAHEFNNLLNVVVGNLDEVGAGLGADTALRAHLERAVQAALGCADLTRQLLVVGGLQKLNLMRCDIRAQIADCLPALRMRAGQRLCVQTDLCAESAPVLIDKEGWADVLDALVDNARDAMKPAPAASELVLRLRIARSAASEGESPPAPRVIVEVMDNGRGMSKESMERAFDPYFTTRPKGEGSGLALAMVRGFVTQVGGMVSIDSVEGEGTTVRIELPLDEGA
ncbi:MAG: PAS domain S-box protein [Burkholderiaceae bacterium]|nr:PAS domain S-box protein [Burkholderiaceae bacterium]